MNTECDICCEKTFIIPCGANIDCKAMVCDDCKLEAFNGDDYISKCYFCCNDDYKEGVYRELTLEVFDCGYKLNKPYVISLKNYNDIKNRLKPSFFKNIAEYCFPCD